MKMMKTPFGRVLDAEKEGLMVSLTSIVERNRTEENKKLASHFRELFPDYIGMIDEDEADDVLDTINEYMEVKTGKNPKIQMPYSEGSNIYLLPITENLDLKILAVDEYYGDGDYEKYVNIPSFIMNEHTTKEDVSALVAFLKENLG
ncbi:hypothetical protein [Rossellomorea marisflavi]|uniref:hypothetical protein n=1 Tax=Rossellomorea marisflavi TaxID=189381 RepID=UPI003F9F2D0E